MQHFYSEVMVGKMIRSQYSNELLKVPKRRKPILSCGLLPIVVGGVRAEHAFDIRWSSGFVNRKIMEHTEMRFSRSFENPRQVCSGYEILRSN